MAPLIYPLRPRARSTTEVRCGQSSFGYLAAPLFLIVSLGSGEVRPGLPGHALSNPICWVGILVAVASVIFLILAQLAGRELKAFLASNFLLIGLLVTGAAAIFPVVLYSTLAPQNSLTAYAVAAGSSSLRLASIWWPPGLALAVTYGIFISRRYAGKISVNRDTQGFY
jgi:cytochrome bd ubiquinol oxidase subunit II